MGLKLNKISDAIISENSLGNKERVEMFRAAEPNSPLRSNPVRYARRFADAATEAGLGLYQQESNVTEIREYFALAARQLSNLIALEDKSAALSPLEFQKALALAICFAPEDIVKTLAIAPQEKFFSDPVSLKFYTAMAHYLDVLRVFLTSEVLDRAAWEQVADECRRNDTNRFDADITLAKLKALEAVATNNAALLDASLAILISDHEHEALKGENRESTRGFICLPGLMFAKLGAARGLECTVKSLYLPLHLLG